MTHPVVAAYNPFLGWGSRPFSYPCVLQVHMVQTIRSLRELCYWSLKLCPLEAIGRSGLCTRRSGHVGVILLGLANRAKRSEQVALSVSISHRLVPAGIGPGPVGSFLNIRSCEGRSHAGFLRLLASLMWVFGVQGRFGVILGTICLGQSKAVR